jgi:hypothetical protein
MRFTNILDEQQRFVRLIVEPNGISYQQDSHTYSYCHSRNIFKEIGETMGLERELDKRYDEQGELIV